MIVARELEQAQSEQPNVGQPPQPESTILAVIPQDGQETAQWLIDQYHAADANNSQLREQLAQAYEEIEQLRGQRCPHCKETEERAQKAEERATLYSDLHHTQSTEHTNFLYWILDLFRNKTIPIGCKVTFLFLYIHLASMRNPIVGQEQKVTLGYIAEGTAQYYGTVSKHLAQFIEHDVIERREDEESKRDKEDPKTIYYWTPQEIIMHPADIDLEKKEHGGKTKKGCHKDGTPLNRYTVTHCPVHGEIGLFDQPGTPKEADDGLMIDDFIRKYQNHVPRALSYRRDPETGELIRQNQDAFERTRPEIETQDEPITAKPVGQHTGQAGQIHVTQLQARDTITVELEPETSSQDQNQDAFDTQRPEIDAETKAEGQRYEAAVNLLGWLAGYGLELQCLPNGLHKFNRIVPLETISQGWKETVREYAPELRQIWNDSQQPPTVASSSDIQNQDALSQPAQLDAQPPYTSLYGKLQSLGVQCDICHYNEAVLIWKAGKRYCQACHEKEACS